MNRIFALILALLFSACHAPSTEDRAEVEQEDSEQEDLMALKKLLGDSSKNKQSTDHRVPDSTLLKQLPDSGRINNGRKEGRWNEYSLDTTGFGQIVDVNRATVLDLVADVRKATGSYVAGKREGRWVLYETVNNEIPLRWNRHTVTHYKNGRKDGEEIAYQGLGVTYQTPLLVRHWKDGVESGIGEIYDLNSPHNLQQRYNAVDGKMWTLETYYPAGQLKVKFSDTLVDRTNARYFRQYSERGRLQMTGYYKNGEELFGTWTTFYENGKMESTLTYKAGKRNGSLTYFHDNGQPWTERVYTNDKLMNVLYNYDRNGKKKNPGTLKDGTGTVNMYDADGTLVKTQDFVNGEERTAGGDREV
jgi:antitoxin component YwqK of YwqJK toxin-antitoxin module